MVDWTVGEYKMMVRDLENKNLELTKEIEKLKDTTTQGFGWKGTSGVNIIEDKDEYIIKEHRKTKSNKILKEIHTISKASVNMSLTIIKANLNRDDETNYREVVAGLKGILNLKVSIDAFNGGYNRSKYYFKYYYYQMKVLEYLKIIKYGGRGKITLINKTKTIGDNNE